MPHEPAVVLQYRSPQLHAVPKTVVRRKTVAARREPIAAAR